MSILSDEQKWQLWYGVNHPSACLDAMILAYGDAVADAAIAADRAARAEPVAWQWMKSGHFRKKIPKDASYTDDWRPLYTAPPAAPVFPEGWNIKVIEGDSVMMEIRRADGKWCAFMPENSPRDALTFEFLSAMLAAAHEANRGVT